MQKITLGLSVHRPEMIPLIAEKMRRHDAIYLEEPPAAGFDQMLAGEYAVEDYIRQLDLEYPAFSRQMCYLLRELRAAGKKIYQVEPFLEILLRIHELFAEGHHPGELDKGSILYPVYLVERNATGALLAYYQTVMSGSFDQTIEAVKQFARRDAARFRLRDSLRAQALATLVKDNVSAYIEAGLIHYPLWRLLRKRLPRQVQVRSVFLADTALKTMGDKGRLYGPGDQLTLLYVFHPNIAGTMRERELAARSIIYSKIIEKQERTEDLSAFPHLHDELACIRIARQLSLDDCRRLFPLIRLAGTAQANQIVSEYLSGSKLHRQPEAERSKPAKASGKN